MSNKGPILVTTGKVRLSYAHLTEAVALQEGQEKKFSASFIIPKSDKKTINKIKEAMKQAIQRGVETKWGGKKPPKLKLPLRDGDEERPDDEAYADSYFINGNCKSRPFIVDERKHVYASVEAADENVYSGCYVYANLSFYPFDAAGNRGIACGLNGVMKAGDGEALSSRVSVETAFGDIETEEDDGLDDLLR